jgi:ferritin-like metal-binding protein YciE
MTTTIDPQDTEGVAAGRALVSRHLAEAHATEAALVTTLQAHLTVAPDGPYRQLLERHLSETRRHAGAIERRLAALGAGSNPVAAAVGLVETVVGQALALGKGPIDLLRGGSRTEKALKNAKDECATEALEIATYDAIEAIARAAGDDETAELARSHREDEERMLAGLREQIPALAEALTRERAGAEEQPASPATGRFRRDAEDGAEGAAGRSEGPIPGYERLSAGQVITRLRDLSPSQLREVAERERAGRSRSTVLARIDALLAEADGTAARDLGRPS